MLDRVESDVPVPTHVRVEDLCDEADDRRPHRVAAGTTSPGPGSVMGNDVTGAGVSDGK